MSSSTIDRTGQRFTQSPLTKLQSDLRQLRILERAQATEILRLQSIVKSCHRQDERLIELLRNSASALQSEVEQLKAELKEKTAFIESVRALVVPLVPFINEPLPFAKRSVQA